MLMFGCCVSVINILNPDSLKTKSRGGEIKPAFQRFHKVVRMAWCRQVSADGPNQPVRVEMNQPGN
jgi:hypothetical protein